MNIGHKADITELTVEDAQFFTSVAEITHFLHEVGLSLTIFAMSRRCKDLQNKVLLDESRPLPRIRSKAIRSCWQSGHRA